MEHELNEKQRRVALENHMHKLVRDRYDFGVAADQRDAHHEVVALRRNSSEGQRISSERLQFTEALFSATPITNYLSGKRLPRCPFECMAREAVYGR